MAHREHGKEALTTTTITTTAKMEKDELGDWGYTVMNICYL